ncbi:MAG: hypothetical protein AAGK14_07585 [Verrucomicrobiota bacterium]
MKLKRILPVFFALMVLMPMIGVGVVWYTTATSKAAADRAAEVRAAEEAERWKEIEAERANQPPPEPPPGFNPALKE